MDFKTPSLPGANSLINSIASKVDEIEGKVLETVNLNATAADLTAKMKTDLEDLKAKTGIVIPELPTVPSLNLQSELTALTSLAAGSSQYTDKLASITSSFGSGLTAGGFSLDSIVSDASSTISDAASALSAGTSSVSASTALASKVPNFELPPGAPEAVEKAQASLLAAAPALKELAHSFSASVKADSTKGIYGDKLAKDTQSSNLGSLFSNLESAGKAFGKKMAAIDKALAAKNTESRQVETTAT
jgi:hypothetical protein